MKKKLVALLTIISILASISTVAFAGELNIPPAPIRDSVIIEEEM